MSYCGGLYGKPPPPSPRAAPCFSTSSLRPAVLLFSAALGIVHVEEATFKRHPRKHFSEITGTWEVRVCTQNGVELLCEPRQSP